MNKKRLLSLGIAWVGAFALVLLITLMFQVQGADSQGPGESDLEADKALAAEQSSPPVGEIQVYPNDGGGGDYPLFAGVDDVAIPAVRINVSDNSTVNAFSGVQVWGAAYSPDNDTVYFNSGSVLWEWPVGGAPNMLGTMVNAAGSTQALVALAYYDGVLYGTKNIAPEAVHVINVNSLVITPTITYNATNHDMGGLSIDPDTGTIYATDDGTIDQLVIINNDGTVTPVVAYPTGQTDIDGLAVGGGRAYMVTDDANGDIYVYNLGTNSYEPDLTAPWPSSETFSAGAWIEMLIDQPGITLSKTVGTDPNLCATGSNISVPSGTDVTYCYEVTNTGDITLTVHELDDSELGPILTGFPYELVPGASAFLTQTTNIVTDTTNIAIWTACNIDGPPNLTCFDTAAFDIVSDTATANVTILSAPSIALTKTVGLDNTTCAASSVLAVGQPSTEVYYCYTVMNTGDVTFTTHDLDDDMLGSILSGFPFVLGPGESTSVFPVTETITTTVTNVATWTAYIDTATFAIATASATVTESPTDVSLNAFTGGSHTLTLPTMIGLLALLVFAALFLIRRIQAGGETE
jgi:hypothetical protein